MARIKDTSVDAVKAAADFVDVVSGRTQLRKVGGRYTGRCPFHEERTPSFSVNAVDKLYYCFGCGAKGDLITFVRETEGLDFAARSSGSPSGFACRSSTRTARRSRTPRASGVSGSSRCSTRRPRFYERTLWETEAGSFVRDYLKGRGLGEEIVPRSSVSASRSAATRSPARRSRRASRAKSCAPRASPASAGGDYFARRLLFPLADARGRVLGFQARKLFDDDPLPAQVRQHARVRALPQGLGRLRARQGARGDRAGGSRVRRRGQHRRDRAPPDRVPARSSRAWAPRSPSSS